MPAGGRLSGVGVRSDCEKRDVGTLTWHNSLLPLNATCINGLGEWPRLVRGSSFRRLRWGVKRVSMPNNNGGATGSILFGTREQVGVGRGLAEFRAGRPI